MYLYNVMGFVFLNCLTKWLPYRWACTLFSIVCFNRKVLDIGCQGIFTTHLKLYICSA